MGVLRRSLALSTGLVVFAAGLFFVQAPATAVPLPGPDNPNVQFVEGTPHSEHVFETPLPETKQPTKGQADVDSLLRDGAAAAGPGGTINVRLVTAKLADNTNPVSMTDAEKAVVSTSNYWKAMTANKLSMTVASKVAGTQMRRICTSP